MIREIVTIDEDLCDGCGRCVPACAEGALRIVDGKARLVADRLCDGMGACLGHCPRGAIRVERREGDAFDEAAVQMQGGASAAAHSMKIGLPAAIPVAAVGHPHAGGCPGSRFAQFGVLAEEAEAGASDRAGSGQPSALRHWPVQLKLLPPTAPVLRGARLLVCADCVPVAYADFHQELLRGRAVVIACPKLDDMRGYVEKLAEIIRLNELKDITVAHMEVPCCTGILRAVLEARRSSGCDTPVFDWTIGVHGEVLSRRQIPVEHTPTQVCGLG